MLPPGDGVKIPLKLKLPAMGTSDQRTRKAELLSQGWEWRGTVTAPDHPEELGVPLQ